MELVYPVLWYPSLAHTPETSPASSSVSARSQAATFRIPELSELASIRYLPPLLERVLHLSWPRCLDRRVSALFSAFEEPELRTNHCFWGTVTREALPRLLHRPLRPLLRLLQLLLEQFPL